MMAWTNSGIIWASHQGTEVSRDEQNRHTELQNIRQTNIFTAVIFRVVTSGPGTTHCMFFLGLTSSPYVTSTVCLSVCLSVSL